MGIAVFVRILWAGFLMLTAAGNASKAADAKNKIQSAVIGAILLFAAYLILYIINPDLVKNSFDSKLPVNNVAPVTNPEQPTDPTEGDFSLSGCVDCDFDISLGSVPVVHAQEGTFLFTVRVVDAKGDLCEQDYNIEILPNLEESAGSPQKRIVTLDGKNNNQSYIAHAAEDCSTVKVTTPFLPDGISGLPYFAEVGVSGGVAPYIASIIEGSLPHGVNLQATSKMPVLTIENLTAKRNPSYFFYENDKFHLVLTNAKPNKTIFIKWQKNGEVWFYPGKSPDSNGWTDFATTDDKGKWINDAPFSKQEIGQWYEWAMVDGKISRPIGFQVLAKNINVSVSDSVNPEIFVNSGAISNVACVTAENYCEDPVTGERSPILSDAEIAIIQQQYKTLSPTEQAKINPTDRCPNRRQVASTCVYPSNNPSNICDTFNFEWRNCVDNLNKIDSGQINQSSLPVSSNGLPPAQAPVGSVWLRQTYDQLGNSIFNSNTLTCKYSDQQAATRCRAGYAGEFCIIGRIIPGCVWP